MTVFSNAAVYVMQRLLSHGFEAYAVGGCVRDMCMGIKPHDTDITTNAKPDEMLALFAGDRVIETGLKHGTVTVLKDDEPIEVTTYRIDGVYADNRHPKSVTFTSDLSNDLSRRDFTVNAMACDIDGNIVDIFGGRQHIQKKTICCVGDPCKRFDEDGLRILRALRFASVLGFTLEKSTSDAVRSKRMLLCNISRERILSEFTKLLCGENAQIILESYPEVIAEFIDGYAPHDVSAVSKVKSDRCLRYAALFADAFTPEQAAAALSALKCDTKLKTSVKSLLLGLDDESNAITLLRRYGKETLFGIAELRNACRQDKAQETALLVKEAQRIIDCGECYCLKMLDVTGRDLIDCGIPQSGVIGDILEQLLTEVMSKRISNQKSALTARAAALYNNIQANQ